MDLEVTAKQPNSKMCFVCGLENSFGLKSCFYELENEEILAVFTPAKEHQGYPGRLHGGIAAAILDETIGRAVMVKQSHDIWGVTLDFSMKFKRPVPLDGEIRVRGRITKDSKRIFEGSGEIILSDGTVAIKAVGKYMKMDINNITDTDFSGDNWRTFPHPADPQKVKL
jgi:acyl-coenzyme A thioesterase PaaI-like protein